MKTLKIFIGYDPKEPVAFHVLSHSLLERSSRPISISPINLRNLKNLYSRQHDKRQSNEFSFSRFLVPYLCNYEGFGVYMESSQSTALALDMFLTPVTGELRMRCNTSWCTVAASEV